MIIISDSSPLISLSIISKLDLLGEIFDDFLIPEEVYDEVTRKNKPFASILAKQLKSHIKKIKNITAMQVLTMDIGPGEAAAIILALENNIKLILIDDAKARKVATHNNLTPIGTLGVLIKAKEKKLIKEVKGYMDQLILNNIHISDSLYKDVLDMVHE
jgi:predicted nucleic acid-binding protein